MLLRSLISITNPRMKNDNVARIDFDVKLCWLLTFSRFFHFSSWLFFCSSHVLHSSYFYFRSLLIFGQKIFFFFVCLSITSSPVWVKYNILIISSLSFFGINISVSSFTMSRPVTLLLTICPCILRVVVFHNHLFLASECWVPLL